MSLRKRKPMRPYVSGLPKERVRRARRTRPTVAVVEAFGTYQGPDVAWDGSYEADADLWPCPDGAYCSMGCVA